MINANRRVQKILMVTLLAWTGSLFAHGLQMTTAQIVQRQENYLYITVKTSLVEVFNRMKYQGKPASLMHLANGSAEQLNLFREALLELFRSQLKLSVGDKPLQSINVKTLPENQLRKLLQDDVAEQILSSKMVGMNHHSDRRNNLRIEVDGFIAANQEQRVFQANFPKELGQILVSYTKPEMQTISPGEQGSQYIQTLLK